MRAWLTDGFGVPHASSSIRTEIYIAKKENCGEISSTPASTKSDKRIHQYPYWCSTKRITFGLRLDHIKTNTEFKYEPTLGPLQSAFAFGASLPSGLSDAYKYQLATKLHFQLAPKMHDKLKYQMEEGFKLLDLGLMEDGKNIF